MIKNPQARVPPWDALCLKCPLSLSFPGVREEALIINHYYFRLWF